MRLSAAIPSAALAAVLALGPGDASAARLTTIGLKGGLSVATFHGSLPTDPFVRNGSRLGAAGGVSFSSACPSFMPFLNSLWARPIDRAISGIFLAPKITTSATIAMTIHSLGPGMDDHLPGC